MTDKYKKRALLFIFLIILSMNSNVKAGKVEVIGGGNSSGSNSDCYAYAGYVACYLGKYQFRATLIDENGRKVAGTNSVDFTYSTDGKTTISRLDNLEFDGEKFTLVNDDYKYKYSDNENDYNNKDDFLYVKIPVLKKEDIEYINKLNGNKQVNGRDNPEYYKDFYDRLSSNISSRTKSVKLIGESGVSMDFLSAFLNYSGYINKENIENFKKSGSLIITDDLPVDIDNEPNSNKQKEIAEKNYYLLLEPTYFFYYNTEKDGGKIYKYGTATEILEWLYEEGNKDIDKYKSGYLVGLSANFVYQAGCNMHTEVGGANGYKKITQNTECNSVGSKLLQLKNGPNYPSRPDRLGIIKEMININEMDNKGHGAAVLQLKNSIIKMPPPTTTTTTSDDQPPITSTIKVILDLCQSDDGIISLRYEGENNENIDSNAFINDSFRVGGATGNSAMYCYDEVEYDFQSIMQSIPTEYKTLSNITIPDATVTVNRSCYFSSSSTPSYLAFSYSDYLNKEIEMRIFNDVIKLTYYKGGLVTEKDDRDESGKGWVKYKNALKFRYNDDGKFYISPDKDYDLSGYVGFELSYDINDMFGKSNNLLDSFGGRRTTSKTYTGLNGETKTFTYKMTYTDGSGNPLNNQCKFEYTVNYDNPKDGLEFRIISLSNPFPARDGTTRIPGTNWLNNHNYVSDYIYNNRGIQYIAGNKELKEIEGTKISNFNSSDIVDPEMMYMNVEPMYTITLTPSIMADIRRYNKDHSYDDIELVCNDENRECYSTFLRNTNYITEGNFGGVCSDETKYSQNNTLPGKTQADLFKIDNDMRKNIYGVKPTYILAHDLNKNYKMDTEDLEILQNIEKNTYFYTCANKSYKSGG